MAYLVEQSKAVDEFQEPLVKRRDLPRDLAGKMCLWVSAAIRQSLIDRFDIDADKLDDSLEPIAREVIRTAAARRAPTPPARWRASRRRPQADAAADDADPAPRRGPAVRGDAGRDAGLRPTLIRRLCYEQGGKGLAVLARGIGLTPRGVRQHLSADPQGAARRLGGGSGRSRPRARIFRPHQPRQCRDRHRPLASRSAITSYAIRSVEEQQGRQRGSPSDWPGSRGREQSRRSIVSDWQPKLGRSPTPELLQRPSPRSCWSSARPLFLGDRARDIRWSNCRLSQDRRDQGRGGRIGDLLPLKTSRKRST